MGTLLFRANRAAAALHHTELHPPLYADAPDSELPATADELMDQFERPMLVINEWRQVTHHNALAAQELATGELFYKRDGRLALRHKQDDDNLGQMITSLRLQQFSADASPMRQVLTLHKEDGGWCLAFINVMVPRNNAGHMRLPGLRLLIVLNDPAQAMVALDPLVVARCLRLTPAEARVAVQLANGSNAKQIARGGGTALSTVRSHIRQAMEKTGVRRQADLIRLLAGLALRL